MRVFNVRIPDELEARFRPHRHDKGDISKIFAEALDLWIQKQEHKQTPQIAVEEFEALEKLSKIASEDFLKETKI